MASRLSQVLKYGWQHSGEMAAKHNERVFVRVRIFVDIIHCFYKYKMWSNQYLKEDFWYIGGGENRQSIGQKYLEEGTIRDEWQKDFRRTRKFLIKYTNIKYERANLREKRNRAYTKHYHAGPGLMVENNVNISRQHYLNGTISIGKNVLFAKNVFIDYSGEVVISDNVKFANGTVLESHTHNGFTNPTKIGNGAIQKKIVIEDNVKIGTNSIILDSCSSIGRHATISAGSVVRNQIPPYSIVLGNPAKVVGFKLTVQGILEFEEENYLESERIPKDILLANYQKFVENYSTIKSLLK